MAAHAHQGAAFIEIFQNCIVYNKDVFNDFAAPKGAEDRQLWLKNGEPMLFAGGTQGIALDNVNLCLKVVDVVAKAAGRPDWPAPGLSVPAVTTRSSRPMPYAQPFDPFPMQ